ncbi:MAG: hypothetical protein ABI837_08355, partial [Acidobacteriota bacterium]
MKNCARAAAFLTLVILIQPIWARTSVPKKRPGPASGVVERIGNSAFIRVEAESFRTLSNRQKELVYWLTQASIAIDPIIYDQQSRFGLRQKYILDMIAARPAGIDPAVKKKIADYTKLFWGNKGNHQDQTAQKFLPSFAPAALEKAALRSLQNYSQQAGKKQDLPFTPDELRNELHGLRQSIFDPAFEPQLTAKSPQGGLDIIQASSNNFYAPGLTLADLQKLQETHPLNSRVSKSADGTLVEEVYRTGTPDGSIPPGRYAQYLGKAIEYLRKARPVAEPGQAEVIDALIKFYQTGDFRDWIDFGVKWVGNNPPVDFANGFIEVYRDSRGAKGTSQSFVSITDEALNRLMQKIAVEAQYFERRAPWDEQYKKLGLQPPLAKAIETVIETGDFGVGTVGDNLPNEN